MCHLQTGALDDLGALIRETKVYLAARRDAGSQGGAGAAAVADGGLAPAGPQPLLLRKAAAYVTRILTVFGLLPVRHGAPALDGWPTLPDA